MTQDSLSVEICGEINAGFEENEIEPVVETQGNINAESSQSALSCGQEYKRHSNSYQRTAIYVESGRLSYGNTNVLENISMSVHEGTIYGLLGSSGCGKTTLLSCIVGLKHLDSGKILICGQVPGSPNCGVPGNLVGYMPQEVALNGDFTIREIGYCFGLIYGMDKQKIEERLETLIELLDLKNCKSFIKNLSDGQKRRASFLVALLHEADILILDEPTVGVDPILSCKIWNHLRELVRSFGRTVIITTHYIEEMRQADKVAIMRSGLLMAEASPAELLEQHNATMLEDVVLHYCRKNEDEESPERFTRRPSSVIELDHINIGTHSQKYGSKQGLSYADIQAQYEDKDSKKKQTKSFNRVRAIVHKNFVVLYRNVGFLSFIFVFPAVITALFCYTAGSTPTSLGLGILNGSDCKGQSLDEFKCNEENLDCAFINSLYLIPQFKIYFYDSEDEVAKAVQDKTVWGSLKFGANFSENIYDFILGLNISDETMEGSKITIRLDTTSVSTPEVIANFVIEVYKIFSKKLLVSCGVDVTGRESPIYIGEPIYGTGSMKAYLAPGVSLIFIAFISSITCGLAVILEKKDGMINRTKVSGVTAAEIMISHLVPQLGVIIIQILIVDFVMFVMFDIPKIGSPVLAFCGSFFFSVSGICMGFLASTLFDEEKNAIMLALATIMPSFLVSGVMWPLESLPPTLAKIGTILPGSHATECIRSILLRGWGIDSFYVYLGFLTTPIYIMLYCALAFIILKIRA